VYICVCARVRLCMYVYVCVSNREMGWDGMGWDGMGWGERACACACSCLRRMCGGGVVARLSKLPYSVAKTHRMPKVAGHVSPKGPLWGKRATDYCAILPQSGPLGGNDL